MPTLKQLQQQYVALVNQGAHAPALAIVEAVLEQVKDSATLWHDAALCSLRTGQLEKAKHYALASIKLDPHVPSGYETLAEVFGLTGDKRGVRESGLQALRLRDAATSASPPLHSPNPGGTQDIISFCLFGNMPRYIETALLNVEAQKKLFPAWRCRFYVDDSVPKHQCERVLTAGAELIHVDREQAKLPGTMWRFLALEDSSIRRILFRDADSVLQAREVQMVAEWEQSGKAFHLIRDYFSHTDLVLAGMWGAITGYLPSVWDIAQPMIDTLARQDRFADQRFLHTHLWPYIRQSLLTHDRVFGFGSVPEALETLDFSIPHIGQNEAATSITLDAQSPVTWALFDGKQKLCEYTTPSQQGRVRIFLPRDYCIALQEKRLEFKVL